VPILEAFTIIEKQVENKEKLPKALHLVIKQTLTNYQEIKKEISEIKKELKELNKQFEHERQSKTIRTGKRFDSPSESTTEDLKFADEDKFLGRIE